MSKQNELEVNEIDQFGDPRHANTFKVSYDDNGYIIYFGNWNSSTEVEVISKIVLDDRKICRFIKSLMVSSLLYDKEFNKDVYPEEVRERLLSIKEMNKNGISEQESE